MAPGPLLALLIAAASAAPAPQARVYKRAARPGEAVLVVVTGNDPSRPPVGSFAGAKLLFHRTEPKTYVALAGIDLEASTGTVAVTLTMYAPGGASRAWSEAMTIRAKAFAERRLTVAQQYVEPPPEQEARAEKETRRVKAVFAEASPQAELGGGFRMPVKGAKTTSRFGERSFFNGKPRAPHSGADIKASTGTPVLAPQAGTIVMAEELYYPGRTVLLDHGLGVYSLFAHLSEV
ncbi:MAG: M23 family metallopeptidase, partial [Elusimicrobia bacterium]|nr:M23 family metallopeptidase [Elusimicrobiota bacterium]